MQLKSPAFDAGEQIPVKFTRDGENIAPPLDWENLPEETVELALVLENSTPSTREPFTQWLVYHISGERQGLPEGLRHSRDPEQPSEAVHGKNDTGNIGYDGPLGSAGKKMNFVFRLYALRGKPEIKPGAGRSAFEEAIDGLVVETAELDCRFERAPA